MHLISKNNPKTSNYILENVHCCYLGGIYLSPFPALPNEKRCPYWVPHVYFSIWSIVCFFFVHNNCSIVFSTFHIFYFLYSCFTLLCMFQMLTITFYILQYGSICFCVRFCCFNMFLSLLIFFYIFYFPIDFCIFPCFPYFL